MNGEGKEYLIEFYSRSTESTDSHSGKVEVRTKSFHVRFISKIKFGNVQKHVDSKKQETEAKSRFPEVELKTK